MDVESGSATQTGRKVGGDAWPSTSWSLVQQGASGSAQALAELFQIYRKPICSAVVRCGVQPADAEDLTHEFLLHLQARNRLARPRREEGRFRYYVQRAVKNFVSDWRTKTSRVKFVPLVGPGGADEGAIELPADSPTTDDAYDREWAFATLDQALAILRDEYARDGQSQRFEILSRLLPGKCPELSHAEAGRQLGLSPEAVGVAVFRMRERLRDAFRRVVGMTVCSYDEVNDEIQHHLKVLAPEPSQRKSGKIPADLP